MEDKVYVNCMMTLQHPTLQQALNMIQLKKICWPTNMMFHMEHGWCTNFQKFYNIVAPSILVLEVPAVVRHLFLSVCKILVSTWKPNMYTFFLLLVNPSELFSRKVSTGWILFSKPNLHQESRLRFLGSMPLQERWTSSIGDKGVLHELIKVRCKLMKAK